MSRSILDDLPPGSSSIARAAEAQARAAGVGFDWPDTAANIAKIEEETRELREAAARDDTESVAEEIGDLLLALVNVARREGLDAEDCLARACGKFERRFRGMESQLADEGRDIGQLSLEELDAAWNRVKSQEDGR